jgi:hypothetical protein
MSKPTKLPLAVMLAALASVLALLPAGGVRAEAPKAEAKVSPPLTEAEIKEKEARKACKVAICAAFRTRKAEGGDIACNVIKTWRKETISEMISKAKVSWPWGPVRCTTDIKLKRETLIKAMTEDKYEAKIDQHQVACEVEREKGNAQINFDFKPTVTFEKGKATKAALHWGKIEAPTLVKGAMWTATATDNTFNVLQGSLVKDINDFITAKCDEVKADWEGK